MLDADIKQAVENCIKKLRDNEAAIIANNVSELAITHRLAVYLEACFPEYSVDIGYNRNSELGQNRPKLYQPGVYGIPDIVVHKRLTNDFNLLVIEIKKENNRNADARKKDKKKLEVFTASRGMGYEFQLGLFLEIPLKRESAHRCDWYKSGQKEEKVKERVGKDLLTYSADGKTPGFSVFPMLCCDICIGFNSFYYIYSAASSFRRKYHIRYF